VVDHAALAHRELALGRHFFQPLHARVEVAPGLPRPLLALLDRLLAFGQALNAAIKGSKIAEVLDLAARPERQAPRPTAA
jgi:hypothetical protein